MKHLLLYALFVYIGIGCCRDTALAPYTYAVAETPWNEALGNHRAVLAVDAPAEAVKLSFCLLYTSSALFIKMLKMKFFIRVFSGSCHLYK